MIIIGHPLIESPLFFGVKNIEAIAHSPNNSVIVFEWSVQNSGLAKYCEINSVPFGVIVSDERSAIFANGLGAKYILCSESLAPSLQSIATDYLLDAKILQAIDSEGEMESAIKNRIDGVIFRDYIKGEI